ncbi:pseudouridine synthase [Burkholderia mallei]|uniref:pseudouridine synthase n=1 Tax=Burkholderia mallei TaxID=13373 RepID=UPI0036F21C80
MARRSPVDRFSLRAHAGCAGGAGQRRAGALEPRCARRARSRFCLARAASGARPRVDDTAGVCRRGSGRPDRAVRGGQADRKRLGPRSEGLIVAGLVDNIRFVYEPYKFVRWE